MTDASAAELHAALVDQLQASRVLTEPRVLAAFRAVPRHLFLPGVPLAEAYRDDAIPTKMAEGRAISSSSQPAIMAIMLEQLAVQPGQHILEIGAGTGYNAALLGELVGPSGWVVTVDIDEDIVLAARAHLAAAHVQNVRVVQADGGEGYAPNAPYDRIIVTASAWDIPPAWHAQLLSEGWLVLPLALGNGVQNAIAFEKPAAGGQLLLVSRSVCACGFMPLRGAFAGPGVVTRMGERDAGLSLTSSRPIPLPADQLEIWLRSGAERRRTGVRVTPAEVFGSLMLWLDMRSDDMATLSVENAPPPPGGWPCLVRRGSQSPTVFTGLMLAADGIAVLDGRCDSRQDTTSAAGETQPFDLLIMEYGPQGQQVAQALRQLLSAWDQAGRPPSTELQVRVMSPDADYTPAPGELVVVKPCTRLVVAWPGAAPA
jgi:protein-L-isoaspartate(D-aspartate) O-methyltransferase